MVGAGTNKLRHSRQAFQLPTSRLSQHPHTAQPMLTVHLPTLFLLLLLQSDA